MRFLLSTMLILSAAPFAFAADPAPANAAPLYQQAYEELPSSQRTKKEKGSKRDADQDLVHRASTDGTEDLTAADRAWLQELLSASQPALALFLKASQAPQCRWEIDFTPGPSTHLPHLTVGIRLARVALLQMEALLDEGKT